MNFLQPPFSTKILHIILSFFFYINSHASNNHADTTQIVNRKSEIVNKIDSLKQALSTTKEDTIKIHILRKIGIALHNSQESLPYYHQALELSISINNKNLEAELYNDIGLVQQNLGNYDKAMDYHLKALRIYEEIKMSNSGDIKNNKGIANSFNNIGNVYERQGDYDLALNNYLKSLRIREELKDKIGIASNLNNIGNVYQYQRNYDLAMDNYMKALRIAEELKNKKGIAICLNNIGRVYFYQNKKDSTIFYFIRSLEIKKEIGDKAGVALCLDNIGNLYGEQGNYKKAKAYSDSSLTIAKEIGDKYGIMSSGNTLANVYSKINDFEKAYEYHQLYATYKDSIFNEEKSKEIGKLEATHEFLMQKAEEEAKAKALKEAEEEKKFRQNVIEYFVVVIVIVLLFVGIMMWKKKMSPVVLRFLVFFTTILFFEFLLVLIAPFLFTYTGGAPLWLMLINSAIASILFIPQNFIQNRFGTKLQPVTTSGSIDNNIVKLLLVIGLGVFNIYSSTNSNGSNNPGDTAQIVNRKSEIVNKIDSLKQALSTTKEDTIKIQLLRKIGDAYNDLRESLPYYQQALELSITIKNTTQGLVSHRAKNLEADCYNDIGIVQQNLGNYNNALSYYLKALRVYEEIRITHPDDIMNKKGIAHSFNNIGVIYQYQGNYEFALDNHLKSLRIEEELKDKKWIAASFNNIGIICRLQGNYDLALDNYLKALRIMEELKVEHPDDLGNKKGIATSFNNIGIIYFYQNKKDSTIIYCIRSLQIEKEIGNKAGVAISLDNIGQLYSEQGKYEKAITYSDSSMTIAKEIGDKWMIMTSCNSLADVYSKINNFKKAYEYHQLYATYKDSIFNEEKSKEIGKLQTKHDLEMADFKKKQAEEETARRESDVRSRRDKLQYSVIVLGVFALIGIALLLSRFTIASWVIEFLTFVPFLLLFETLLVLIDPYLEQYTSNRPIYTVVANTVFAIGLFPLQQFMEKKLKWMFYRKKRQRVRDKTD